MLYSDAFNNPPLALYSQALCRYQALWDALDDLDQHTQVLEPHPDAPRDYSCYSRRISLSRHASLHLTLNPTSPATRPAVTFLGSDVAVGELQRHWFGGCGCRWDPNCSLRANLEAVLQLELHKPKQQGGDVEQEDRSSCAICFGPAVAGDQGGMCSWFPWFHVSTTRLMYGKQRMECQGDACLDGDSNNATMTAPALMLLSSIWSVLCKP